MNAQDSTIKLSNVIGGIPKYVGICITLAIAASVLYEYAYFSIIGSEFLSIYSPADFLKLSIYWMPSFVLFSSIGIFMNYRVAKHRAALHQYDPNIAYQVYKNPDRVMNVCAFVLFTIGLISIPNMKLENIIFIQFPILLALAFVFKKTVSESVVHTTDRPAEALLFYIFIMILLITSPISGLGKAVSDLKKTSPVYEVRSSNGNSKAIVVRNLDKGIIFREVGSKSISFVPWDDVKLLRSDEIKISERTLYEYVKGWFH